MSREETGNSEFPEGVLGSHTFWELEGVEFSKLDDLDLIESAMVRAAKECGATILDEISHQFHPQGVTFLLLLAESHLSFHSWPEKGAAAVDLFSCSPSIDPSSITRALNEVFRPERIAERELLRGKFSS